MNVLGNGIYRFAEAARLTGLNPRRVRAWFEGWTESGKVDGRGRVFLGSYPDERAISFLDLIEVCVAGHLRERGFSLIAVRQAHSALASQLDDEHPFARQEIYTDGENLFVRVAQGAQDEMFEILQRQHVIPQVLLPYLQRVDYDPSSLRARQWKIADGIVVDPARQFGKPIVATCSIPTAVLAASYAANNRDVDAVADWYGITPSDVEVATKFESRYCGKAA